MKQVLVTDADQRSALAVTRSLGRKNVTVITADVLSHALAGCSRHSRYYATYPSPASNPDDFVSAIHDICRKHRVDIVMPMTEMTTALLLSKRESLPDLVLPFAPFDVVDTLSDKCSLVNMAQSLDIPAPDTVFMNPGPTAKPPENSTFPLVLKPAKSWLLYNGEWNHTTVRIADSLPVASGILADDPSFSAAPYMLQKFVPGHGAGVFAIYDHGQPLAFFAHRRLREKPPGGGVSVLSESVVVDPLLESYARKILDHVGWHGVAMVEFRISDEGIPYLMEVNTRFWGSLQLAVDAGVDFPWLLYRLACGETVSPVTSYKTGKRLRWLLGDMDSLYLTLRDPAFSLSEKTRAILGFLRPDPFRTRHEVDRLSDMGPFWWELKQYVRDLLR